MFDHILIIFQLYLIIFHRTTWQERVFILIFVFYDRYFNSLSFFPIGGLRLPTTFFHYAYTVLCSVMPFSFIVISIWPIKCTFTFSFVVDKLSCVPATIGPELSTFTHHHVVDPLAIVLAAVSPNELSLTFDLVI